MKSCPPSLLAALLFAALAATLALAAQAGPPPDARAAAYLASRPLQQALLLAVRRPNESLAACRAGRVHVLAIDTVQEIVMGPAAQPESGAWRMTFETEGCGAPGRHSLWLAAEAGTAPRMLEVNATR